uniref:Uncharacterized protein n=1 Tax=Sus scrofa TaxID=9823 RepID=A0A8D2A8S0_PIG
MASPGHSDLGDVAPEIKASERRTAVAIADLEWREMAGDDCEFHYGDGTNEAQESDFPTDERNWGSGRSVRLPRLHSQEAVIQTSRPHVPHCFAVDLQYLSSNFMETLKKHYQLKRVLQLKLKSSWKLPLWWSQNESDWYP